MGAIILATDDVHARVGSLAGAILLITEVPLMRHLFHTTSLNTRQWGLCLLMSLAILVPGDGEIEERV